MLVLLVFATANAVCYCSVSVFMFLFSRFAATTQLVNKELAETLPKYFWSQVAQQGTDEADYLDEACVHS